MLRPKEIRLHTRPFNYTTPASGSTRPRLRSAVLTPKR